MADGAVLVSNWSGGTVERIAPDGSRSVLVDGIASPAGIAVASDGTVFVAAYSGDVVLHVARHGRSRRAAEGLATPTGIAFARDGRLLVANRDTGEVLGLDLVRGTRSVLARGLSLPVGVVETADGSLVVSQYGGRVTRIGPEGAMPEFGAAFTRPGVGILTDGPDAVLVADNGASVVRRVSLAGGSTVVADGSAGSLVALGRAPDGSLLVGTWGEGLVYRVRGTG